MAEHSLDKSAYLVCFRRINCDVLSGCEELYTEFLELLYHVSLVQLHYLSYICPRIAFQCTALHYIVFLC